MIKKTVILLSMIIINIFYISSAQDVSGFLEKHRETLIKSADEGNSDAQFVVGLMYFNGDGVTKC